MQRLEAIHGFGRNKAVLNHLDSQTRHVALHANSRHKVLRCQPRRLPCFRIAAQYVRDRLLERVPDAVVAQLELLQRGVLAQRVRDRLRTGILYRVCRQIQFQKR